MATAPYVLGAIAATGLLKALWRPHRAVVREGAVRSCPGQDSYGECDPTLRIETPPSTEVYSTGSGRVVAVGIDFVHIALRNEPTVIYYDGVVPEVEEGQHVGRGQKLGASARRQVAFGVQQFRPEGVLVNVDPSSWLAARGQRIAADYTGDESRWCEAVSEREVVVPRSAGAPCELYEPDKARFALLPVTVEVQR